MSSQTDDNLERRISRQLDGELGEADRAELTRELLRRPESHRLMDETSAADAAAGEALRAAFGQRSGAGETPGAVWHRLDRARRPRAVLLAAAAAILLAVAAAWAIRWFGGGQGQPVGGGAIAAADANEPPQAAALPAGVQELILRAWNPPLDARPMRAAARGRDGAAGARDAFVPLPRIQGPRRMRRAIDRHIFSVFDETDSTVYLLGVDRVRTRVQAVGEDL